MKKITSSKSLISTGILAALISLSACQKQSEEVVETDPEAEVEMSAEPAEGNDPAIVADDLDDVDAQAEAVENSDETPVDVDPTTSEIEEESDVEAVEEAPELESVVEENQ